LGLLLGCGGDPTPSRAGLDAGSNDAAEMTIDAGMPLDTTGIRLEGSVLDAISMQPLADISVALLDRDDSKPIITDSNGRYQLSALPAGAKVVLTFQGEGMVPMLSHIIRVHEDAADLGPLLMFSESGRAFLARSSKIEVDDTLGWVGGVFQDTTMGPRRAVEGATFSIEPMTGTSIYTNPEGLPDRSLTATSSLGVVGVVNAAAGDYTVGFSAPNVDCHTTYSSTKRGALITRDITVRMGALTNFGAITCQ